MENIAKEAGPSFENDRQRPGPWPPGIMPFFSKMDHDPRELKSWAKRTGFNSTFSAETTVSSLIHEGAEDAAPPPPTRRDAEFDLEKGIGRDRGNGAVSMVDMDHILGQRSAGAEINPLKDPDPVGLKDVGRRHEKEKKRSGVDIDVGLKEVRLEGNDLSMRAKDEVIKGGRSGNGEAVAAIAPGNGEPKEEDLEIDFFGDSPDPHNSAPFNSGLTCDLLENQGFG